MPADVSSAEEREKEQEKEEKKIPKRKKKKKEKKTFSLFWRRQGVPLAAIAA